ncbi:glycoside hydrolase family 28 protein [Pedobacter sp. HMF7647]|uniref:Glycoside hydrolase family 28 protein n=1 Tax=Hufsiella arboris TaxID=2695275 RepID=A0A7K1Y4I5_9SPHI|nr:glycoside hydrolase family 28 protein [Hufsiella arboris]MXV49485.1 glycoside hydrolase family 28 protein [Hufsiella arboris]
MVKKRSLLFIGLFAAFTIANVSAQNKQEVYSWNNLPKIQSPVFKTDTFNIVKFGAVPDGITLNTKSINAAIAACNAKGGGVVLIPGGLWSTGPVELKSNVNLHIVRDAILQFTDDFSQYPLVEGNWEGLPQMRNQSPLYANNAENIAVTGSGIVDGNGNAWRMVKKDKLTESQWKKLVASGGVVGEDQRTWYPSEETLKGSKLKNPGAISPEKDAAFFASIKDFLRPNLLVFSNCKKVLLEGVTFQNSPAWCLHPILCTDLTVKNVYAKNPWYAQNGDGIDVESCRNVLIENSTFDVGDDGICIKSGRDEAGRKRGVPTENLIARNNVVYHAHGGFVIGSEMSGGARNLFVSDCSFIGTDIGLRFKTTRGRGGVVEKIFAKNINMKDITGEAILFDMYYMAQDPIALAGEKRTNPKVQLYPVTEATPVFREFTISDITCNGASKAVFVRGLPEMSISNISFENMVIKSEKGIDLQEAKNISFKNIHLISASSQPLVNVQNTSDLKVDKLQFSSAETLFKISGIKSKNLLVSNTDTNKAKSKTEFADDASNKSLTIK